MDTIIKIVKTIADFAGGLVEGNKDATGSAAYDLAYVFVGPWVKIADGASQLLGMFA
ncbi:hypothetical protein M3G18_01940 [Corynebacterium sp. p3-SID1145]|uniref:hypothetical protein n=1 Tax=unclassified Corynebacterium TaxID=2624378 RepID=UPI0021AA16F5|nr:MULTISPECIES: hypothetical protein [unclassified Corynebacterium]MCT1451683.1 hypothetical protein [Corynebacterium sp. p3-SID1145]MCT1460780.1 hypothetical protein [Corynebacterium sp. p3-SID1140]